MKKITTLIVLALTGIVSVNTYAQGFGGGMGLGAGSFGGPGMGPGAAPAPAGVFNGPGMTVPGADFGGFGFADLHFFGRRNFAGNHPAFFIDIGKIAGHVVGGQDIGQRVALFHVFQN